MSKSWRWPLTGFVLGGVVGMTVLTVNVVGAFDSGSTAPAPADRHVFDVQHTPELLVPRGSDVGLTYDVVCGSASLEGIKRGCVPEGTLHVRAVGDSGYTALRLAGGQDRILVARVPARFTTGAGFEYYAEIADDLGDSATVPAGGIAAPEHSWTVTHPTTVDLGTHVFGTQRSPRGTAVVAGWGTIDGALGLSRAPQQSAIGPASFDVAPDGSIVVLDQVNHRLARFAHGAPQATMPIDFGGGDGDVAVAPDGTIYVLDQTSSMNSTPLVRTISPRGSLLASTPVGAPIADMLRVGPMGPVVHTYPGEQWLPTGAQVPPLTPEQQVAGATSGRPIANGREVVVRASRNEASFALVAGDRILRSWLVLSQTNLGEVQLAEPSGNGVLVVIRLWTERQAVFHVLRLGATGTTESFDVPTAEWAESSPLSRFRLHGNTLYQLRASPLRARVVTYQIGGTS